MVLAAASFGVASLVAASEKSNHHPDALEIKHMCTEGVEVRVALATHATGGTVTAGDVALARAANAAYGAAPRAA